jgi:hypothetical protein
MSTSSYGTPRFARNLFAVSQSRHQVVVHMTILFPIVRPFAPGVT